MCRLTARLNCLAVEGGGGSGPSLGCCLRCVCLSFCPALPMHTCLCTDASQRKMKVSIACAFLSVCGRSSEFSEG